MHHQTPLTVFEECSSTTALMEQLHIRVTMPAMATPAIHPCPTSQILEFIIHQGDTSKYQALLTTSTQNSHFQPFLTHDLPSIPNQPILKLTSQEIAMKAETMGCQYFYSKEKSADLQQLHKAMSQSRSDLSIALSEGGESEVSSGRRGNGYVPGEKSGKWSGEEHMKYIAFIDFNKDRMRSREKRRSNKFYQEMADFIVTRNALQCRSHHQKLQQKYTHAPKIVNLFKPSFDKIAYRDVLQSLQAMKREGRPEKSMKQFITEIASRSVETQTDIAGLNLDFINAGHNCYIIQPQTYRCLPPPQPAFYYNQFFMAPHPPSTAQTLPSVEGTVSPATWQTNIFSHDIGPNSL